MFSFKGSNPVLKCAHGLNKEKKKKHTAAKVGTFSLTQKYRSCLTASVHFLFKNRGCPASCTYFTKPMTSDSPNSTVGACVSNWYFTVTECTIFQTLTDMQAFGLDVTWALVSARCSQYPCSVCFSYITAGNLAVTVQRAHSGNTGKGFSTRHTHTHTHIKNTRDMLKWHAHRLRSARIFVVKRLGSWVLSISRIKNTTPSINHHKITCVGKLSFITKIRYCRHRNNISTNKHTASWDAIFTQVDQNLISNICFWFNHVFFLLFFYPKLLPKIYIFNGFGGVGEGNQILQ